MSMAFPPFDPDPPKPGRKPRTFRGVPLRMLAPNMLTLIALCAGLTAMRMAIEGRLELAVAGILFAAVLDAMDGRVARLLKSTSRFGAELDSLADFVNFGVAPAFVIFVWLTDSLGSIGWIASLVYALCAALRLARFNVQLGNADRPSWAINFFVGVPAPAAAMSMLLPIYLHLLGVPFAIEGAPLVLLYQLVIAFLMVSSLPTFSGKKIGERIPREWVLPVLVAVVIVAALLFSFPWIFLTSVTLLYLAGLPFAAMSYRRMAKRYRKDDSRGPEDEPAETA